MPDPPRQPAVVHQRRPPRHQPEHILPLHRVEARVEVRRHLRRRHHRHRRRPQMRVQRRPQPERLPAARQVQCATCPSACTPRVGAPRAGHRRRLRRDPRHRRLQRRLHARMRRLPLPADERPAVVLDLQGVARHGAEPLARRRPLAKAAPLRTVGASALGLSRRRDGRTAWTFNRLTDGIARRIEETLGDLGGALFEPVIRLGVTGLSRAGKTVFITSLVANLIDRGRMPQLTRRRRAAASSPPTCSRSPTTASPASPTRTTSTRSPAPTRAGPRAPARSPPCACRCAWRPPGSSALAGPRTVHLDIVDYPGEWLLDLPLMNQDFEDWSAAAIATARDPRPRAATPPPGSPSSPPATPPRPLDEATARAPRPPASPPTSPPPAPPASPASPPAAS